MSLITAVATTRKTPLPRSHPTRAVARRSSEASPGARDGQRREEFPLPRFPREWRPTAQPKDSNPTRDRVNSVTRPGVRTAPRVMSDHSGNNTEDDSYARTGRRRGATKPPGTKGKTNVKWLEPEVRRVQVKFCLCGGLLWVRLPSGYTMTIPSSVNIWTRYPSLGPMGIYSSGHPSSGHPLKSLREASHPGVYCCCLMRKWTISREPP
jgi:hypothetical protein